MIKEYKLERRSFERRDWLKKEKYLMWCVVEYGTYFWRDNDPNWVGVELMSNDYNNVIFKTDDYELAKQELENFKWNL